LNAAARYANTDTRRGRHNAFRKLLTVDHRRALARDVRGVQNTRDIDTVLAPITADVDWPNEREAAAFRAGP
jgi:hypothetical protein